MNGSALRRVRWSREHLVALAGLLALLVLLLPLPPFVLDLLLTASLAFGLAVLLVALSAEGPLGFPSLPGVLVVGSMARVALALAAARSLLAHGTAGTLAQTLGGMLTSAGENPIGGVVALGLLMLTSYVVLSLGLMRLAEVAARFALDALPGQQMALDAALGSGRLEAEAGAARAEALQTQNAFYGAMDGAARFLRGEMLAVALIVVVAALAALAPGGATALGWTEAFAFSLGLGIVVLTPGLLMMAGAAVVLSRTRAADAAGSLGGVLLQPGLLVTVAVALLAVALAPGAGRAPLLIGAAAVGGLAYYATKRRAPEAPASEPPATLQLRLGTGLLSLAAQPDLVQWLNRQRVALSDELGFAVPPFVVSDDPTLPPHDFAIVLNGAVLLQAPLCPGRQLAVAPAGSLVLPEGEPVVLPDGRRAMWVREADDDLDARDGGQRLAVREALALHVRSALSAAAPELFDRQRAHELLEMVRVSHPAVVRAYEAAGLTEQELRQVGRALLAERVSLVERVSLLEAMAEVGPVADLAERVRPALQRTITRLVAPEGTLCALALSEGMQQELRTAVQTAGDGAVALPPERAEHWREALRRAERQYAESAVGAVVLCPTELRPAVAELAREAGAVVAVVHAGELLPLTEVLSMGALPEYETGPVAAPAAGR